jgi:hypothetical protein
MRIPALLILAALAVLGVLFAMGVFDGTPTPDATPGLGPAGTSGDGDATPAGTTPGGLAGSGPSTAPEIEPVGFKNERAMLFVSPRPNSWSLSLVGYAGDIGGLKYATWYTDRWSNADGGEGPGSNEVRGLDKLGSPPDDNWLNDNDIAIVWLDQIDPNALPESFWSRLAARVADGRTGVWVRMGVPPMSGPTAASVHPLMTHPVLASLLPVGDPTPFEGEPLPGVYKPERALEPTEAGLRHRASRLVPWPRWSRHWWKAVSTGSHPWHVAMTYPVGRIQPGAEVLLEVQDGPGRRRPALVASGPGNERVLWQAFFDFGQPAYRRSDSVARMSAWFSQVAAWLAGEADTPPSEGGN